MAGPIDRHSAENRGRLPSGSRPEAELLIRCARVRPSSKDYESIEALLGKEIDWDLLLDLANRHRVGPLLYLNLTKTSAIAAPDVIIDRLKEHCQNNTRRNLFMAGELVKILTHLEDHSIRAIPYKGPLLALSAYGDLALREFYDLDILVERRDVLGAKRSLISLGYEPPFDLNSAQEEVYLRTQCEHSLWQSQIKLLVEIQWSVVPRYFSFPLDLHALFDRLRSETLGGRQVMTLSTEDLLILLCVHGAKHLWERLGWIVDIAELLRTQTGIDWREVFRSAKRLGAQRMLLLGLCLATDLLGAALPRSVRRSIQDDPTIGRLASETRARLFRDDNDPPGLFKSARFHMRARERLQDKIRYCYRLAMTPTVRDWEVMTMTPSLPFLYYPLRAVRLIRKYGPRFLR